MVDTDQPQPCSELDESIARALGWKQIKRSDHTLPGDTWQSPGGFNYGGPPPFSTNTATAMAALEQLCKPKEEGGRGWNGWSMCYDKYSDGEIIHSFGIGDHDEEAPTLAHAAALAMLAALEAEK